MKRLLREIFRTKMLLRSSWVALIVGSVLMVINHYEKLLDWDVSSIGIEKVLLTYLVPFLVATYGSVSARLESEPKQK